MPALVVCLIPIYWLPYIINWRLGLNSDVSVTWLMARHILQGERPLFFWGNYFAGKPYLGALEEYVGAFLMRVLGPDEIWPLYLAALTAYVLAAALLVRITASRSERRILALLLLLAPPAMMVEVARSGMTQGPLMLLGWVALAWLHPALDDRPSRAGAYVRAVAGGAVLAVATYCIGSAMMAAAAIAFCAIVAAAREWRAQPTGAVHRLLQLAIVTAPGLVVLQFSGVPTDGLSVPGWPKLRLLAWSFTQFSPLTKLGSAMTGLNGFYAGSPIATSPDSGLLPHSIAWPTIVSSIVLAALALAGAGILVASSRRQGAAAGARTLYWPVLLGGCVAAFLVSPGPRQIGAARHLIPLFIPMAVCLAAVLARARRRLVWMLGAVWIASLGWGHVWTLGSETTLNADIDRAIQFAEAQGAMAGYGDYWLSYSIITRTRERQIIVPVDSDRHAEYRSRLQGARRLSYWMFTRRPLVVPAAIRVRRTFGEVTVAIVDVQ